MSGVLVCLLVLVNTRTMPLLCARVWASVSGSVQLKKGLSVYNWLLLLQVLVQLCMRMHVCIFLRLCLFLCNRWNKSWIVMKILHCMRFSSDADDDYYQPATSRSVCLSVWMLQAKKKDTTSQPLLLFLMSMAMISIDCFFNNFCLSFVRWVRGDTVCVLSTLMNNVNVYWLWARKCCGGINTNNTDVIVFVRSERSFSWLAHWLAGWRAVVLVVG